MPRILILFAHPRLEKSRANKALLRRIPSNKQITFRDLYELYPDLNVDIRKEQTLLQEHDIIILHHPLYWYSVPPLLKQWIDLVLAFGWAYGPGGTALTGKSWFHTLTTGGGESAYTAEGFHGSTLEQFMLPLKRTATLCGMRWLPPFAVHGSNKLSETELELHAERYHRLLAGLSEGSLSPTDLGNLHRLNDAVPLHL